MHICKKNAVTGAILAGTAASAVAAFSVVCCCRKTSNSHMIKKRAKKTLKNALHYIDSL